MIDTRAHPEKYLTECRIFEWGALCFKINNFSIFFNIQSQLLLKFLVGPTTNLYEGRAPPIPGGPKPRGLGFWCLLDPSFVGAKLEYALNMYALNIPCPSPV